MTDRELLELAARANWMHELANEEVSFRYDEKEGGILYIHADNQGHNGLDREFLWNPLEQDYDALRLAVKLRLDVEFHQDNGGAVSAINYDLCRSSNMRLQGAGVDFNGDEFSATRRAITKAAADIGRYMQ